MPRPKLGNHIEIHGDVAIINMVRKDGSVIKTLIDAEDVELAKQFTWFPCWNENNQSFYVKAFSIVNGKKTTVRLHRLIMNAPRKMQVDHINHDTLDNRKSNLRVVTAAENSQNLRGARRHSRSGIRGVFWNKQNRKWEVQLRLRGKLIHIGHFKDKEEARKAAMKARAMYFPFSQEAMEGDVHGIR